VCTVQARSSRLVWPPLGAHLTGKPVKRDLENARGAKPGTGWTSVSVPIGGGPPAVLMQNAAALTWAAANRVLFSEIRSQTSLDITGNDSTINSPETPNYSEDDFLPGKPRQFDESGPP